MEALIQRDDVVILRALMIGGVLSRDLHGALVRLRAGVAEKEGSGVV